LESDNRLRSEYRKNQMADALRRPAGGRPERQAARQRLSQERPCDHRRRAGAVREQRFEALCAEQRHRPVDLHEGPAKWLTRRTGRLRGEWQTVYSVGCFGRQSVPGGWADGTRWRTLTGGFEELHRVGFT